MSEIWSVNDEGFYYDDISELLSDNEELSEGDTVYVARKEEVNPVEFIDEDAIIEMIGDIAYDNFGEAAEDYPEVTKEARTELSEILGKWIEKHCKPRFCKVVDSRPYILTKEDLENWS